MTAQKKLQNPFEIWSLPTNFCEEGVKIEKTLIMMFQDVADEQYFSSIILAPVLKWLCTNFDKQVKVILLSDLTLMFIICISLGHAFIN